MPGEKIAHFWDRFKQKKLFSLFEGEVGPITRRLERLIRIWEVLRIEEHVTFVDVGIGRPAKDRQAIARSFVAKSVLNLGTTSALIERLHVDTTLRRLCGFERRQDIPSEATFSRAFAEFASTGLGQRAHEALVQQTYGEAMVGHVSRDSTAIEAREKAARKAAATQDKPLRRRGRPRKGEASKPAAEPSRLEKQSRPGATLEQMMADLPQACDTGAKQNSKGFLLTWRGYKLHLDVADTGMPLSAILTSASVHDSQVAIPLLTMSGQRTGAVLYELMDAAYDSPLIEQASRKAGRVPIIDLNPRRDVEKQEEQRQRALLKKLHLPLADDVRFNERSTVERANARLKDEFGASTLRVRGPVKAMGHLMFGVCALAADTLLRLLV